MPRPRIIPLDLSSDDYSVLSRCQDQPLHPYEWSSFQDRTRGGTCRFRRHYPVKDSFINKRALLSTRIASTIPPLNLALMKLLGLMEQAALANSDCDKYLGLLEDVTTLPADARQPVIEKLDAAKAPTRLAYLLPKYCRSSATPSSRRPGRGMTLLSSFVQSSKRKLHRQSSRGIAPAPSATRPCRQ